MTPPPKYPRVPRFVDASRPESSDDLVLAASARAALLDAEVVVEEKLDGMNVMVWLEQGSPRVGTRGGGETSDRSGERGRLRAWASVHSDQLAMLRHRFVVYGEWLRRRHVVPYERLPAQLIGFDVLDREAGQFLAVERRDALLSRLGIPAPPLRFRGVLGSDAELDKLLGPSAFANSPAEGLVIRTVDGGWPRVAKYFDPRWDGIGSAPWVGENHLVPAAPG